MHDMDELTTDAKMIWVLGLMRHCPCGEMLETCPAKDLMALTYEEIIVLVQAMTTIQLDEIVAHHTHCMQKRVKDNKKG